MYKSYTNQENKMTMRSQDRKPEDRYGVLPGGALDSKDGGII